MAALPSGFYFHDPSIVDSTERESLKQPFLDHIARQQTAEDTMTLTPDLRAPATFTDKDGNTISQEMWDRQLSDGDFEDDSVPKTALHFRKATFKFAPTGKIHKRPKPSDYTRYDKIGQRKTSKQEDKAHDLAFNKDLAATLGSCPPSLLPSATRTSRQSSLSRPARLSAISAVPASITTRRGSSTKSSTQEAIPQQAGRKHSRRDSAEVQAPPNTRPFCFKIKSKPVEKGTAISGPKLKIDLRLKRVLGHGTNAKQSEGSHEAKKSGYKIKLRFGKVGKVATESGYKIKLHFDKLDHEKMSTGADAGDNDDAANESSEDEKPVRKKLRAAGA